MMSAATQPVVANVRCKSDNAQDQVLCKPYQVRSISPRELPIPVCIFEFYCVTPCPPGNAYGCMDLRNRGLDLMSEVTVWPKQKHGTFTTGEPQPYTFVPEPISLNDTERRMCSTLGMDERDFHTFMKSWEPPKRKPKTLEEIRAALYAAEHGKDPRSVGLNL